MFMKIYIHFKKSIRYIYISKIISFLILISTIYYNQVFLLILLNLFLPGVYTILILSLVNVMFDNISWSDKSVLNFDLQLISIGLWLWDYRKEFVFLLLFLNLFTFY